MAQEPTNRVWIIDPLRDRETGELVPDRTRLEQIVDDLLGTLEQVGGVLRVTADRVQVGELPPTNGQGRPQLLAQTVGWVVQWQAFSPVAQVSETARLMDEARGEEEPRDETPFVDPLEEQSETAAVAEVFAPSEGLSDVDEFEEKVPAMESGD